ncbi:hypothetical protein CRG98_000956 [Punica granatum]|uniref:Uncharacterized protein n=1 Tax=Punica granatum TaxID=22663 RepID=A0A2I0LD19_PUNGR|nr:hypothetical protein CRG98_000956 [Punica granatum]
MNYVSVTDLSLGLNSCAILMLPNNLQKGKIGEAARFPSLTLKSTGVLTRAIDKIAMCCHLVYEPYAITNTKPPCPYCPIKFISLFNRRLTCVMNRDAPCAHPNFVSSGHACARLNAMRLGSVHLPGDARRTHVKRSRYYLFTTRRSMAGELLGSSDTGYT